MRAFSDIVEEQQLSFISAPEPDGSFEIDIDGRAVDVSWGWHGRNAEALKAVNPDCVWTVLECDGELYVTNGWHIVNRLYYLVTNEPYDDGLEDFIL